MDDPSPAERGSALDPPPQYYRLDRCRLTYAEGWRLTRSRKVVSFWLAKVLGIFSPLVEGGVVPQRPPEGWCAHEDLPGFATAALDRLRGACELLGFGEPLYRQPHDLRAVDSAVCLLRQPSGETVASLICVQARVVGSIPKRSLSFHSELSDGTTVVTSNGRLVFDCPPEDGCEYLTGQDAAALYRRHALRLAEHHAAGQSPVLLRTPEEVGTTLWRDERRQYDFKAARGLYVLMTATEVENLRARRAAGRSALAAGCSPQVAQEVEAVLMALDRRDRPVAASRAAAWTLLVVSLAAFVAAGIWQWDATFVALIVGALLLHEGGHYVAMRAFGYRNLRMFFIPLFGAAVSGWNPRAIGWQKAVVSLAGPLPGLLLGAGSFWMDRGPDDGNLLNQGAALVLIGLNALNLLPFLPLDGGRFLYETLFVRRPGLRTGFLVVAGAGLLALAYRFGSPILALLSLAVLATVGRGRRVNRALRKLSAEGVALLDPAPVPGQERSVRVEALPTLLVSLKQRRGNAPTGNVVSEALAVIDLARARPPGVAATLGLLALYVAACALSWFLLRPLWSSLF